jgi:UDP-arabinose 4-epimerase
LKVLVTGGAGYVGSHACKALAAAGHQPVAYDNLVHGHRDLVRWGPFEQGDTRDRAQLDAVLAAHRPDAALHFAAYAYVGESVGDPARYWDNNVHGSLVLLEALRDHGVERLVFSSTCATYGEPSGVPIPDDHPQWPVNPYGWSKLAVERMLADFHRAHGLRSVALRYFNAAGADPAAETGEDHDPETHLIPLLLDAAAGRREAITLFGDDYPTPDGTCVRDYVHVSDLADAHLLALDWLQVNDTAAAFNLGNGQGFSVREVIDCARRVTDQPIAVRPGPRRAGDPPALVGDAARAHAELGWTPRLADLDTIVATAWRWHQARFGAV